ncbi:NAD-dependent epimerase/dehydratase family protein [Actinokineospora fastidiosa]|uniref:NAD-dependent epimerase/dehydratase family protein n=1 Tax=Actinokineospora fastidiosa TaxID=1816 RepID=UPI00167121EB|nr:NAD(P)-dependent oxidoreductase [Actinokineospora fastidiosa]
MTRQRALVVGGTGFLGRHIAAALAEDYEVTVTTRDPAVPGRTVVLDPTRGYREQFAAALRELAPAVVVNAAGETWRPDPAARRRANIELPRLLAEAMADCPARFIHLGSSLEYGPVDPPAAIGEDTAAEPMSDYGRTKLDGTAAVLRLRGDAVVLRVFNAIGAGMSPASVLGSTVATLRAARAERRPAVIELLDLPQSRDFVDARDVAAAVAAAATRGSGVVNIGSGTARAAEDVVRALAEVSGVGYRIVKRRAPRGHTRAVGSDWQLADIRRAGADLGWAPRHGLADTLHHIWNFGPAGRRAR